MGTDNNADAEVKLILDLKTGYENGELYEEYVDKLEEFITKCNTYEVRGEEYVPDAIYDDIKRLLLDIKPDSSVLAEVWSEDSGDELKDFDMYLVQNPMMSINTVKDLSSTAYQNFKAHITKPTNCIWSVKENGHGVRVVYDNGDLVSARTRGRSSAGRDITRHMRVILGNHNDKLEGLGIVEIRGEVLLPFRNVEQAKVYRGEIKSAFSGVSSLICDSANDVEISLLDFVAYNIFCSKDFAKLSDKFSFLEEVGFTTPLCNLICLTPDNVDAAIAYVLQFAEYNVKTFNYDYYTDGVVLSVDALDEFNSFGSEGSCFLGNIALKMGFWEQNIYSGTIKAIEWKKGKSKLSPVACLDGVLTSTGNTVCNVPLYNPYNILLLEAYPGRQIYFRYGGEAGVVPCTSDGRGITEL